MTSNDLAQTQSTRNNPDHGRKPNAFDEALDRFMRRFYEVISFPDGGSPDWSGMLSLFSPHARITRVTPEGIDYLDVEGFRNMAAELLEVGAYTSFFEREIGRRVDYFGKVLHVASAYETKIAPEAADYLERAVNSLQLVAEGGHLKIISLAWDDHAPCDLRGMGAVERTGGSRG